MFVDAVFDIFSTKGAVGPGKGKNEKGFGIVSAHYHAETLLRTASF
jgi:hypothetical protein